MVMKPRATRMPLWGFWLSQLLLAFFAYLKSSPFLFINSTDINSSTNLKTFCNINTYTKASLMEFSSSNILRIINSYIFFFLMLSLNKTSNGDDIFLQWDVVIDTNINPLTIPQEVITINGMFPGPLINASTNDNVHVNVFNHMDEPLLFTWNGVQLRLNSWQDGVSGTNCPIQPATNWTYVFQLKDQVGSFFYFPSTRFQKAGGGFGPIRINNRIVINVPFPKPEAEFDLLIGDWYRNSYKIVRDNLNTSSKSHRRLPDRMLMNGKGAYLDPQATDHEFFTVTKGKTYRFRISNVGTTWSFNFVIQKHRMLLVETEGSYTNQTMYDSLDVHVGQSYSVLFTADQEEGSYYIVASPKLANASSYGGLVAIGLLNYGNNTTPKEPLPVGPDPFDIHFSINQAKSIRWNMSTGAARPNPQSTFNVTNVTLSQTFVLRGSTAEIHRLPRYTVNNVSYITPDTPLKLADQFTNGSGVYKLDVFPTNTTNHFAENGVFVATGIHRGWIELVFENDLEVMDAWHLDGFGFFVVGFGDGEWTTKKRSTYNLFDPVVRSTVQVYPGRWTAVYAYLDNPGMWNLRSQHLKNWYLGQELYLRVYDADPNPARERPPPNNLILCGIFTPPVPPPAPPTPSVSPPTPSDSTSTPSQKITWFYVVMTCTITLVYLRQH